MKKMVLAFLSLSALGFQSAQAANMDPDPGNVLIEASMLYWSSSPIPGANGTTVESFVINNNATPPFPFATNDGTIKKNQTGYNFGFRLAAIYAFKSTPLLTLFRFSQVSPSHKRTITGPNLLPVNTSPLGIGPFSGSAFSDAKGKYQNVEFLIGKNIIDRDPISMSFYLGLNYLHSDINIHNTYRSATVTQFDSVKLWLNGIGPEFYIDNYLKLTQLGCGELSMRGTMQAGFIVVRGPALKAFERNNGIVNTDVKSDVSLIVDPSFDIRIALSYSSKIGNSVVALEAGYEFLTYNIVSSHGPFATVRFSL